MGGLSTNNLLTGDKGLTYATVLSFPEFVAGFDERISLMKKGHTAGEEMEMAARIDELLAENKALVEKLNRAGVLIDQMREAASEEATVERSRSVSPLNERAREFASIVSLGSKKKKTGLPTQSEAQKEIASMWGFEDYAKLSAAWQQNIGDGVARPSPVLHQFLANTFQGQDPYEVMVKILKLSKAHIQPLMTAAGNSFKTDLNYMRQNKFPLAA